MNNYKTEKTALITGATKGIGYELTKLFAEDSYNLVLIALSMSELKEIKEYLNNKYDIDILIIEQDLSVPNASLKIFRETVKKQIIVDVLVNNAGIGDFEIFNNEDITKISQIMQINIVSLTELTKLYLKEMVDKKEGKILNVSSMAAFQPGPHMAVYYASKAYVQSFSEAIASELEGTGVTVTTLCPGPTKTGFQDKVGSKDSKLAKLNLLSSSKDVAKYGYKALNKGKRIAIPGFLNIVIVNTVKFIPGKVTTQVVKKLQELNRLDSSYNN